MKKLSWKELSVFLVYAAVALIAISDTGFQLLLLKYGFSNSSILRKLGLFLLFLKLFGTRYTKKEFFLFFPLIVLSLYNYRLCGNIYCFYNVLFVACMKDIDYEPLFKSLFYSTFAAMLAIGILSFFGIGGLVSLTQDFGRNGFETRYCFGLYHPNIWHQAFSRCMVYFSLGYYKQLKWPSFAALFLCNLAAYSFSLSRTGLLTGTMFLGLLFLYKYLPKLMNRTVVKITLFSTAVIAYAGYYLMLIDYFTYPTMFSQHFNKKWATGRLGQAAMYLLKRPFKALGTRFPDDGTVVDCGFLRMLSESGYLLGGLFLICLFVLLALALKHGWGQITAVILMTILYSLYEVHPLTRAPYNIPVFYFGLLLYPQLAKTFSQKSSDDSV